MSPFSRIEAKSTLKYRKEVDLSALAKRQSRRRSSRRGARRISKGKPSVAIIAGAAVGPALIGFGTQGQLPIWQQSTETMGSEAVDRLGIVYAGYKVSDGSHMSLGSYGAYVGTLALIVGALAHKGASMLGLNASLARAKMPFRI